MEFFAGRIRKIRYCDDGDSCGAGKWPLVKTIFQWPQLLGAERPPAMPPLILSLTSLGLDMAGPLRRLPQWYSGSLRLLGKVSSQLGLI